MLLPLLLAIYAPLLGWISLGMLLARCFPHTVAQGSRWIGPFLYWVGVPLSTVGFLRQTALPGEVWLAAVMAYVSYGVAWLGSALWRWWWQSRGEKLSPIQWASFQLAAMLGNTGYLGYPIGLAVGGAEYFGWVLVFDLLGTLFGAYGLGTWVAARSSLRSPWDPWWQVGRSPAIWGFVVGVGTKGWALPPVGEQFLRGFAWGMIPLMLVLLGVRLVRIPGRYPWGLLGGAVVIRLLWVPLLVGLITLALPLAPLARLMIILQAGMPPAMATLVLAETYHLDQDLTVATLAVGTLGILLTLPLWLWLWG